ncbi:MAG: histidine kinase [Sutterellaceae bacterium]|nr:histidine kinase [Burkholderiaceae bacterium]MDW8430904.1 histidine kinase [Sutterellaceae bacterium]
MIGGFLALVVQLARASAGAIRVVDPATGDLQLIASIGLPDEIRECDARMPSSCGICGAALRADNTRRATRTVGCEVRTRVADRAGMDCAIAVPLNFQQRPIGVLNLFFARDQEPPDCVQELLMPFGQLLGLALENEKLARDNLHARVVLERQHLATEIHDAVAQSLTFARMRLSTLDQALQASDLELARTCAADIGEELKRAHARVREVITHFRAGMDARGLLASLRETAENFYARCGIELTFECHVTDINLTPQQQTHAFNIVQEALANIRRHSGARRARLTIHRCQDALEITIEDDGRGLPPPIAESGAGDDHHGLRMMRERAERAGGWIRFDNPLTGGTRVRLVLPAGRVREGR